MGLRRASLLLLAVGALLAATPTPAWPCSLVGADQLSLLDGLSFSAPPVLLVRGWDGPPVPAFGPLDGAPLPLALDPVGTALFASSRYDSTTAFTTTATLGPGRYALAYESFAIAGDGIDVTAVADVRGATLRLSVYEGSGCGVTAVAVGLPASPQAQLYVLELEGGPGERSLRTFVAAGGEAHLFGSLDVRLRNRFCARLHGYAWDGQASDSLDLGCIDPGDDADPRITYTGGCAATGAAPGDVVPLAVALLVMGRVRRRQRGACSGR